ncbi:MAG: DUF3048 domain-containing protein [Lachnospiraceae bacterium]|nr:DUF3048 domain-containing protein [Lachnospiraceae bacterium]MDE6963865.1 DUF3048 domain-containing protein [Lachnospiraceae bacterium]
MTLRRKWLLAVIGLSIGLAVSGCGKEEEDNSQPQITVEPIPTATQQPEEEPEPEEDTSGTQREVVDGKMQSYLTGEWKDEKVVNRRPIAVMVPNNAPALPQYGISRASIIYEAPVEGRITRLMPVFEDFDDLERIGPVRSSRDYYIYIAMGYEAIYCNWGLAVPYVEELINRDTVQNISAAVQGIHNPADEAFGRVSRPGKATEFTGYLFIDGMLKAAERLGYDWEYDDEHVAPFLFAADDKRAEENYAGEKDATMIYPGGQSGNQSGYGAYNPYFEYHEDEGVYYRYQDGSAQIDELDGSQLKVSNVILQYCHGEVRDAHDYLAFGVHGDGKAIVFTGGKAIEGTWERFDGDSTPAKFLDKDGKEIVFNQGKTWICNIWDEYGEFVEYN